MTNLFVAMPYGVRKGPLDYERPERTVKIDFDGVWKGILRPAVPAEFETKRADELLHSGLIDRLYIKWLLEADIVLADLTFFNPNVYYEVGIRQALAKKGTVLVACEGTKLPFDLRNQSVNYYDYFAAPKLPEFISKLRLAIENTALQEVDSPVHVFVPELFVKTYEIGKHPDAVIQELTQRVEQLDRALRERQSREEEERFLGKLQEAHDRGRVFSLYRAISTYEVTSVRLLEKLAIKLRDFSYFDEAIQVLERTIELNPNDWELLRELGFTFRKKGPAFYPMAESYMGRALEINDADAELHGMLGGLFKRRCDYRRALQHYRRAYELEPDNLYSLVTLAGMSGALGLVSEARNLYQKLQATSQQLIIQGGADHWTYFCLGEAAAALNDQNGAIAAYRSAIERNPPVEHVRSEAEQLEFLQERNFAADNMRNVIPILRDYIER